MSHLIDNYILQLITYIIKIYSVVKLILVLRKELVCVVYLSHSMITLDMYEEHAWNKTGHFYILYVLQIQQDLDLHKFLVVGTLLHMYKSTCLSFSS